MGSLSSNKRSQTVRCDDDARFPWCIHDPGGPRRSSRQLTRISSRQVHSTKRWDTLAWATFRPTAEGLRTSLVAPRSPFDRLATSIGRVSVLLRCALSLSISLHLFLSPLRARFFGQEPDHGPRDLQVDAQALSKGQRRYFPLSCACS